MSIIPTFIAGSLGLHGVVIENPDVHCVEPVEYNRGYHATL